MDFDYPPLGPHFDPRKVKGRLGTLVSLQKENYGYATALEVTAGGKLYQVVVSDEQVGKELLKSGLKSRVTLIPLNKIQPYKIPPQVSVLLETPHHRRLKLICRGSARFPKQ